MLNMYCIAPIGAREEHTMSEEPKTKLFREKSLEAVESPESLNDYLRVTSPGVWLVMAAVIALLAGGILWGIFGHIRTTVRFPVAVGPDKQVCYVGYSSAEAVLARGVVTITGRSAEKGGEAADYLLKTDGEFGVAFVSEETPAGVLATRLVRMGDPVVEIPVITDLPEGVYEGEAVTEDLQPISLLLQ